MDMEDINNYLDEVMTKDKSLQDKAIKIKGNDYVLVSNRILYFNENYKNGSIRTRLVSEPSDQMVVIEAKVIPDIETPERYFSGFSQAKWGQGMVNTTAALENAETSAVGRALAMMGIGVIDSVASVDEMKKSGVKEDAIDENDTPEDWCIEHQVKMDKYSKEGKSWYSHKLEGGAWCNGRNKIH